MIIVHLMGGLGNQMFQYAAARSLALHHNINVEYYFLDRYQYAKRKFALNSFNVRIKEISLSKRLEIFTFKKQFKNFNDFFNRKSSFKIINENKYFIYDKDFFNYPSNSLLRGFWQSELYFKKYSDIIKEDFQLKSTLSVKQIQLLEKIRDSNSVSIHIRRGDYVTSDVSNSIHGLCDMTYYKNAIEILNNKIDKPIYFIFSDDILWAKENLRIKSEHYFITNDIDPASDLIIMSLCKHNIIANSSFSWWGAWLNKNDDKIVIAPKKWATDYDNIQAYDLIPSGWIVI